MRYLAFAVFHKNTAFSLSDAFSEDLHWAMCTPACHTLTGCLAIQGESTKWPPVGMTMEKKLISFQQETTP